MTTAGDTGVIGRRIGAFLLDALLATVLSVLLGVALADRTDYAGALRNHDCKVEQDSAGETRVYCQAFQYHDGVTDQDGTYVILDLGPAAAIAVLVGALVFVVAPAVLGATIGKLAAGVRVVRADGSRPGVGAHLARWALLAVDGTVTLGICGLALVVTRDDHRRLGDMVAGTYVVRRAPTTPSTL